MIWTTKEINQVIRLRKAGCTAPELAAMLGIPESRAKGYISGLVARGKIPRMGELPAPRYFPEAVDRKTGHQNEGLPQAPWIHPANINRNNRKRQKHRSFHGRRQPDFGQKR